MYLYGISFHVYCLISSSKQSYEAVCVSDVSVQYLNVTSKEESSSSPVAKKIFFKPSFPRTM